MTQPPCLYLAGEDGITLFRALERIVQTAVGGLQSLAHEHKRRIGSDEEICHITGLRHEFNIITGS